MPFSFVIAYFIVLLVLLGTMAEIAITNRFLLVTAIVIVGFLQLIFISLIILEIALKRATNKLSSFR